MNKLIVFAILCFSSLGFAAGWPAPTSIIEKVKVDLDKDGLLDEVFLTLSSGSETEIDAELDSGLSVWVYLSSNPGEYVEYKNLVIDQSQAMVGSNELLVTPQGSVKVITAQDGGRDRWTETLTLAYRDGDVVLAGYTYHNYDSLTEVESGGQTCDLNLLNGKGTFESNGIKGTLELNAQDKKPALILVDQSILSVAYYEKYCLSAYGDLDQGDL